MVAALKAAANASELGTYLAYDFHPSDVKVAAPGQGDRVYLRLFSDPDEGLTFTAEDAVRLGALLRAAGELAQLPEEEKA